MKINKVGVIAIVLLLQCLIIGWLILRFEIVLSKGTEVRFTCKAYDPYDPFLGRYLQTIVECTTTNIPPEYNSRCENWFVRLEPSESNLWSVVELALEPGNDGIWVMPKSTRRSLRSVPPKGENESYDDYVKRRDASSEIVVSFPSKLFVNEGVASAADAILMTQSTNSSRVAVYKVYHGKIILEDIEIEGKSIQKYVRDLSLRKDDFVPQN